MQNNLHRWYDAAIGQWLSEDPIGFYAGDVNIRRYGNNSPVKTTDPQGLAGDDEPTNSESGIDAFTRLYNPGITNHSELLTPAEKLPKELADQLLNLLNPEHHELSEYEKMLIEILSPALAADPSNSLYEYSDAISGVTVKIDREGGTRTITPNAPPVKLATPPDLAWHYDRNDYNLPPPDMAAALMAGWIILPDWQSMYHRVGPGNELNQKLIPPLEGPWDPGMEAVYDGDWQLVTDPINKGTYNYCRPPMRGDDPHVWLFRGLGHYFSDMLPFYILGNDYDEITPTYIQRVQDKAELNLKMNTYRQYSE